jgi:hypothetical protein
MSERGTGRTSRQLAALPDGAWYLVPNHAHVAHCKRLLREAGRHHSALLFVTVDACERSVWGRRPIDWDVDHAFFECVGRRGWRAFDAVQLAAGMPPLTDRLPA